MSPTGSIGGQTFPVPSGVRAAESRCNSGTFEERGVLI